jgi:hypothetical protein
MVLVHIREKPKAIGCLVKRKCRSGQLLELRGATLPEVMYYYRPYLPTLDFVSPLLLLEMGLAVLTFIFLPLNTNVAADGRIYFHLTARPCT